MGHIVDSWMTPKQTATITERAHLTTWEQLLNEFVKSLGRAHRRVHHVTMAGITHDWT